MLLMSPEIVYGNEEVDFARDIKPILAANCFSCHGADDHKREGDLRLDTFDGATMERDGRRAIVPGHPESSEVLKRISTSDPDLRMPPADSGKTLTTAQAELLQQWIASGAQYRQHWAFVPPQRPEVPVHELSVQNVDGKEGVVSSNKWVRTPIDAFILKRLQAEGLQPSPEASPETLLRRLSLDLTGLPPELNRIENFSSRDVEEDWASTVDQMLASPHFGEKWGRAWLDAARYADSDGFEKDKPRFVWFYRDWVVKAFNQDMPYNQFLVEQLAGDLLPDRTQDQLVATGFLRNSMINEEGGVDPEQFRMEAMFDRMDAIGKAMLGLTIQCTQCHNHKYDPLTQREYYQMFAFLNNCDEAQATVYTDQQMAERSRLLAAISEMEQQLRLSKTDWKTQMASWMTATAAESDPWIIVRPQLDTSGGQKHYLLEDGSILAQGYAPTKHTTEFAVETDLKDLTGFRLELLNDGNLPHQGPGRSIDGLCALSEFQVVVTPRSADGKPANVKWAEATSDVNPSEQELASIYHDKTKDRRVTGPIAYAIDGSNLTAWGIDIGGGRSNVPRNAVFVPEQQIHCDEGFRITFKLVQTHGGWNSDDNQNNNLGRFRLSVTNAATPIADPIPPSVRALTRRSVDDLSARELQEVFSYWRTTVPDWSGRNQEIEELWSQHPRGTTQLVLQERPTPRSTWLLTRGDFLRPAEQVEPGVPMQLHRISSPEGPSRLQFARWVADPRSPTTARAIVNRIWHEYFGQGLVRTTEDLGTQGDYPSHPELLDWLAVELIDHGWSLKHIHRLILNSAVWRQSSYVSAELQARDPENRLLARGARFRVSGESVRDIALFASGLLNPQIGGPGVYPPAPEFLFQPPASYGPKTWNTASDSQRYRRAIYTFRFRSVPYPVLQNFDTPRGDTACVRRNRSNTPIQALTTLNEELFMECSRSLARKLVTEVGPTAATKIRATDADSSDGTDSSRNAGTDIDIKRLETGFRRCTARRPTEQELGVLLNFLNAQRKRFETGESQQAVMLAADRPDDPQIPPGVSAAELAAWTATARVLLNLDETITRE